MNKNNAAISSYLLENIKNRYGQQDFELLEEHLDYANTEHRLSELNKKKHFFLQTIVRGLALIGSVSGSVLALWTFENTEVYLPLMLKIALTLVSIFAPFLIVAIEGSCTTNKHYETWLRHRFYLNNFIDECLMYSDRVKEYGGDDKDASKLLLTRLTEIRIENNATFKEQMHTG